MKLQAKIWLGTGIVIASIMTLDLFLGYRDIENQVRSHLDEEARIIRAILMATRRVYHQQFVASELPLNDKTVGFLPAHALSRISADFPKWIESGLRFNNVSDKPRNPRNQADADELVAMEWFRANPNAPDHVSVISGAKGAVLYHFTAPIWVETYCLKCHGDQAMSPATIRDTYTAAYDYKVGDLRGVMSIKLPMDEIRQRVMAAWMQLFWIRAGGYVLLMLLLGALMQRMVTRRLARLEHASRRMQAGDLSVRVDLSGNDEVSRLADGFNEMATAIEQHDAQVARLNQIYAALSETNQTIVRVEGEAELLDRICRIAVEYGGAQLAWIGRADETRSNIVVAARFGSGLDFLDGIRLPLDSLASERRGPSATAWKTNRPVIVQDYLSAESTRPWHERARPFGWQTSAAFPIVRGGEVHMVLSLYHTEPRAFDEKMIALLSEMAMDIGYALDRIDLVAEQKRLSAAMRESEERYRAVVTTSQDGFWLADSDGYLREVNDAYVEFSGYSREELLCLRVSDIVVAESAEATSSRFQQVRREGASLFESRHRTKFGEIKPVEVSATYMPEQGGCFSVFIRDLSKRDEAEARIQHLTHFDTLTGLPNLTLFADRFAQALGFAQRNDEPLALIFLDLDHFKNINDNLGHRIGDLLLIEVTRRFQNILRAEDTVSRLGGDEFVLLLPHADAERTAHVGQKLLQAVAQPVVIEGSELGVTSSMGIGLYPTDGKDFETLLRKADTAANWAKQEGRNTYRFFAPEMQARSARLLQLETALRRALERDELLLHYQPQIDLGSGAIVGVEALIRWRHPEQGLISPAEFIPIAESSGLILPIGEWVLRTALKQLKGWMDDGLPLRQVAVNLSAVQFRQQDLPAMIESLLADAGLPNSCLELELTESVTMEDPLAAIAMMDALHARGVMIAIDDFGTGYSSLNYLKRFQVDKLKIDQSFVRDITHNHEDGAIVQAIINLATTLKFKTIAEGVETGEQLDFLRAHGCQEIQGYLFSRPLPAVELADWVRDWRREKVKG
ncbi:MAG: EAL domain-containing protein [Rhodocyclaceae bacterium]|nr:EAL domain-containing protein [Rhodocyclaceae bacterium]